MKAATRWSLLIVSAVAGLVLSCGEAGPPPIPRKPFLVIVNRSQFELLQLYVHHQIDGYRGQPNLLQSPLLVDRQITLQEPTITAGSWYVTVVRVKVEHGPLVAVTTATPIDIVGGTYTLWVFDQSFRLWKPDPLADSGVTRDSLGDRRPRSDLGPSTDGAPRSDTPRSDAPRSDTPRSDAPRSDVPRADTALLDGQPREAQ